MLARIKKNSLQRQIELQILVYPLHRNIDFSHLWTDDQEMKWNFYNKFCKYLLLSQADAFFSKTRYLIIYFMLLVACIV